MIHVAVADDYAPIRTALEEFFDNDPDFEWAGGAADAEGAVLLVRSRRVDVLLLDLSMPGVCGLSVLPLLRSTFPHLRIVVLSAYPASVFARRSVALGASNYLEKPAELDDIIWTIRKAMTERHYQ